MCSSYYYTQKIPAHLPCAGDIPGPGIAQVTAFEQGRAVRLSISGLETERGHPLPGMAPQHAPGVPDRRRVAARLECLRPQREKLKMRGADIVYGFLQLSEE